MKMKKRIAIIGAGPAGLNLAARLSSSGFRTRVYEEHNEIGLPVQCTGIVTDSIRRLVRLPDRVIVDRVEAARIHPPSGKSILVRFARPDLVLDRAAFDRFLASQARHSGARILTGHRLISAGFSAGKIICIFNASGKRRYCKADILVGADGPYSTVARLMKLGRIRHFWTGIQAVARLRAGSTVDFYPHIGTYGWIVPAGKSTARIGVVAEKNPKKHFEILVKMSLGRRFREKILEMNAGPIPIYEPGLKTSRIIGGSPGGGPRAYLLGDAAGHVKATTGGGIVPGLQAGSLLSECISKGADYDRMWKKKLGRSLLAHLLVRMALDRMDSKDYDSLIKKFSSRKLRKILGEVGRDSPLCLAKRLLLARPSLLFLARHFMRFGRKK